MSESQERMCAIVEPAKVEQFLAVCRKWDVLATVIGEVTEGDRLTVDWHGERIVDVPPRTVAHEGPVYERPMARPRRPRRACRPTTPRALPRPTTPDGAPGALARRRQQPGRRRQDLGHRAVRPLRPRQHRARPARGRRRRPHRRGLATAASRSRSTATPATRGSTRTPARSSTSPRPTATSPSPAPKPLAVTNCLNFGSPEEPEVMWQFAEAVRGLADGCRELGLPVTGGNVEPLQPDRRRRDQPDAGHRRPGRARGRPHAASPRGWRADGETVLLLGETRPEFGGSAWASGRRTATSAAGRPPSTSPPSARSASCSAASAGGAGHAPRTTWPTADWRRPSPSRRCGTASARGSPWTATRSRRCSASPPPAPSSRPPTRRRPKPTAQWAGVPVTELGTTGGDALAVDGLLELPLRRAPGRLDGHAAGALRRRPSAARR